MIVDAHVHVFLPATEDPERTVDELAPPEREAPVALLEENMAEAGVEGAVLVPLGPEDGYVARTVQARPERFAAIAVADGGDHDPGRVAERLAAGFSGLRMFGFPGARWRGSDSFPWLPVLRRLASDGKVLWLYPRAEHLPTLDMVADALPDLPIVLNHCGFTHAGVGLDATGRPRIGGPIPQPHEAEVLALARHPQVSVLISGAYGFSSRAYPYPDVGKVVLRIADTFGIDRLAWASDFPWIVDDPGYVPCLDLVEHHLPGLSPTERAAIVGGNIRRILSWEAS